MTHHYQDRKLVKQPKPIRFDEYQEQMISAIANWEGNDFSKTVRMLVEEGIRSRMDLILSHKPNVSQADMN